MGSFCAVVKAAAGSTIETLSEESAVDVDIVVPAPKAATQPQPRYITEYLQPGEYRLENI